jgi:hypothetical protein
VISITLERNVIISECFQANNAPQKNQPATGFAKKNSPIGENAGCKDLIDLNDLNDEIWASR